MEESPAVVTRSWRCVNHEIKVLEVNEVKAGAEL